MKFTIVALVFSLFTLASQADSPSKVPFCKDTSTKVCKLRKAEAKSAIIRMMLANEEGIKLVHGTGRNGLEMDFLEDNIMKVTILKHHDRESQEASESIKKYEIDLIDCRGTDACSRHYKWTVIATRTADGYTSFTEFKNTLIKE